MNDKAIKTCLVVNYIFLSFTVVLVILVIMTNMFFSETFLGFLVITAGPISMIKFIKTEKPIWFVLSFMTCVLYFILLVRNVGLSAVMSNSMHMILIGIYIYNFVCFLKISRK